MRNFTQHSLLTVWLLVLGFIVISCNDQAIEFEKQSVQFTLNPESSSGARTGELFLPENTRAIISIASSSGAEVFSDLEISVTKTEQGYVTEPVELPTGAYAITDFIVIHESVELYLTPKAGGELSSARTALLPMNFTIAENRSMVTMPVTDVRDQDLKKFGYTSAKQKANTLSITAYDKKGASIAPTRATAEVRQNKKLITTFTLAAGVNNLTLEGDHNLPYTLTVYTSKSAKTQTIDLKKLKQHNAKNPFKVVLDPALVLTIDSYVDEANEYEEYFSFRMDGKGRVNINWGDGEQSIANLPLEIEHEYTTGNYTAIVTGDINKVTDFSGFSYSSIITTITGLTNLTSLRVYNPSWGAVPIKVDLSNCKKLETINIAKYGAPYEPCDLRTDFKLPKDHNINTFIFDATSFDITREFISAEELEVMVTNIYNNTVKRKIHNGKFFVNPVVTPNAATQQKLDVLENEYQWSVGFNDEIYEAYNISAGRSATTSDSGTKREQWLRERFSNSSKIIQRGRVTAGRN